MDFDFTTPKGLKSLQATKIKKLQRREQEKEDKRAGLKKILTFLLIFILSSLESRVRFL